jgi:ethanolamine utilization protein EutN
VRGNVVATTKDINLHGHKLLIVKQIEPDNDSKSKVMVAVDTVGAGFGETVLVATGSSARKADAIHQAQSTVDAAIVAIVDTWEYQGD